MRHILSCFSIAVALVAASPTRKVPRSERGVLSKFENVLNGIGNTVYHTANVVRRQKESASGEDDAEVLKSLDAAKKAAAVEQATKDFEKPFGNAALWKEALDFDLEKGGIHDNRNFYHIFGTLQEAENSSLTVIQPTAGFGRGGETPEINVAREIARALQYLQFYPAQIKQSQASDPENTIGERGM